MQNSSIYFLNSSNKMASLIEMNAKLNINDLTNNLIFVYTAPKVGSTAIVSSLRIFYSDIYKIIHIHDEYMLNVIYKINDITVNDIVTYNAYLGKNVYVIDVYRTPIERKISTYFEKLGAYHFNNTDEQLNKYTVSKIIHRFNNIFPHIANEDYFFDKYNIPIPNEFDYINKYLLITTNNIKYLKLRLSDSKHWDSIFKKIFKNNVVIINDYETINKPIKELYTRFKAHYKIPINLLEDVVNSPKFKFFYNERDTSNYFNEWRKKSTEHFHPYSLEQFNLYMNISLENCHYDYIQLNHYVDAGCLCKACLYKRKKVATKLLQGGKFEQSDTINHDSCKKEYLELLSKRAINAVKISNIINQFQIKQPLPQSQLTRTPFRQMQTHTPLTHQTRHPPNKQQQTSINNRRVTFTHMNI